MGHDLNARKELKKQLVDKCLDVLREDLDALGTPQKLRKSLARSFVDNAEKTAKGPSDRSLKINFNKQLKAEAEQLRTARHKLEEQAAAVLFASLIAAAKDAYDTPAASQPAVHNVPSPSPRWT